MYAIIVTGGKQYKVEEGLSLIHIQMCIRDRVHTLVKVATATCGLATQLGWIRLKKEWIAQNNTLIKHVISSIELKKRLMVFEKHQIS